MVTAESDSSFIVRDCIGMGIGSEGPRRSNSRYNRDSSEDGDGLKNSSFSFNFVISLYSEHLFDPLFIQLFISL